MAHAYFPPCRHCQVGPTRQQAHRSEIVVSHGPTCQVLLPQIPSPAACSLASLLWFLPLRQTVTFTITPRHCPPVRLPPSAITSHLVPPLGRFMLLYRRCTPEALSHHYGPLMSMSMVMVILLLWLLYLFTFDVDVGQCSACLCMFYLVGANIILGLIKMAKIMEAKDQLLVAASLVLSNR
jgi:hypothetical protein